METTRILRVNSKFRESGTACDFTYSLGDNIVATRITDLTLVSARVPRMFGNMYYPINQMDFMREGELVSMFVPQGQYTALTLATAMSAVMVDLGVDVSYDVVNHLFVFVARSTQVTLLVRSPIAAYIGLLQDTLLTNSPVSMTAQPTLDGPNCVYLQSNDLSRSLHCVDSRKVGTYIPLIAVIPCDVPYGFTINYECRDVLAQQVSYRLSESYPNLTMFDLQLCDQYGNVLSMQENSYCDFVFKITVSMS